MPKIIPKLSIELLKKMIWIRQVEETIAANYSSQEMRCPIHLSIGQEASAVGVCNNLTRNDKIFSNHRCHAHYLAKGGNLNKMIAELYGKRDGCCGGRGGSMHLFDKSIGIFSSVPIVSSSIPLATGVALAYKIENNKNIVVSFLGDGSLEEGVFHESLNFASIKNLPILFVCENNLYSVYTHINERQPNRKISDIGVAHKIKTFDGNGNDIIEINNIAQKSIDFIKKNQSPVLLTIDTYRYREHCGPNYDNDLNYRSLKEFKKWKKNDPIKLFENKLLKQKIINVDFLSKIKTKNKYIIDRVFSNSKLKKLPKPQEAKNYVYA